MKSKRLLLLLLMALIAPWAMNAQTTVTIGEGTATSNTNPIGTYYNYSITEQLYTAEEIGMAGTISSISFYYMGIAAKDIPLVVYMANVDAEDLTSGISLADADEVFSGTLPVTTTAGWVTINLDTPFAYDGTSSLLIGCIKDYLYYFSGQSWQGTATTTTMARYTQSDSAGPYTTSTVPSSTQANRPNIQMEITPSGGPTCDKPATLVVSDITGYGATCTWESNVGNYTFEYKKAADSEWRVVDGLTANTYTLSDLEPMTAYNTRVKAVCGAGLESGYRTANFTTLEVCPDGKICIGEGTATSTYLPTYNFYNYSLTEQIYTAEEIGQAGAILSVDIYSVGTVTRTLEFYMVSTEKETFTDGTDWIAATASDLVYNGSVAFAANSWNTIEFDNPFIYDGHSNVALIVRDMTGSYVSGINFYVFDAPSQAIRIYRDASAYDLANPGEGTVMDVKNRVRLVVGEPPACPKPTGLAVDYQGGTEATISWTSDATAWNMRVNGTEINGTITNPYTLTGLELATTYEVEVQANCGDATSEWAGPVSFTTDACMPEDQCALTFVVTDSYGDGWNGASIQIYDYTGEELGDLLATVTNENLDGQTGGVEETQTITLNFCNGQELAIIWTAGNYDDECSYTITDLNGDVVAQDDMELAIAYTINCTVTDCRTPSNFAASEVGPRSVVLSWTENGPATEWVIAYLSENDEEITEITVNTNPYTLTGLTPETMYAAQVTPVCEVDKPSDVIYWTTDVACPRPTNLSVTAYPTSADVTWNGIADAYDLEWALMPASESKDALWLQYDNGTYASGIGNSTANTWTWGVMYPASMLDGNGMLSKVSIYENSTYNTEDITINVYTGGDTAPGTLVYTETITPEADDAFHEINLAEPVIIDPTQNLWITLTEYGTYVLSYCSNGDNANNDWVNSGGTWAHIGDLAASLAGDTWMIRGYVEPGFDPSTLEWNPVSGVTSPYTLEGLQPETTYVVRVKSVCGGEDGESAWTMTTFTTPSACDMPIDLAANDITYNSAKLSWTGYQESYNLRYRHTDTDPTAPATIILEAHDTWGDGTGYQMLLDADATAYGVEIPVSGPYTGTDYSAFEYLIPENADCDSNTENLVFDGSVTLEIPAGVYDWCIVNPEPGGNMWISGNGDIAGRYDDYVFEAGVTYHFTMQIFGTGDGAALVIDRPLSDWTEVTVNEVPYTLTGLNSATYYEWQVQGVNTNCGELDWTEIQSFTTPEMTAVTQTITLAQGINWVSFYVETDMDALKEALVEALPGTTSIIIKSQKNGQTSYNGTRWRGALSTLDLALMYQITVTEGCEFTLEAAPLDPAQHSITIKNGPNWIGFPFTEAMTPTDAFAGLPPVSGDVLKSKTQQTNYSSRWRGALSSLVPGQGYIYNSADTEDKVFVYPTSSSKATQNTSATVVDSGKPMNKIFAKKQAKINVIDINIMPQAKETNTIDKKANMSENFKSIIRNIKK